MEEININDVVLMKKKHPCKNGDNKFIVLSFDGEVRLKCLSCNGIVLLKKSAFLKNFKKKVEL